MAFIMSSKDLKKSQKYARTLVQLKDTEFEHSWKPIRRSISLINLKEKRQVLVNGRISIRNENIPYMLIDASQELTNLTEQITSLWKINKPRAVLVTISDGRPLEELNKLKLTDKLVQGLLHVSMTVPDVWICTQGINVGLSHAIGEAFHVENTKRQLHARKCYKLFTSLKTKPKLIGICQEDKLSYSENFHLPKRSYIKLENKGSRIDEKLYDLNPYHSHFILVRENTVLKEHFDTFMSEFELSISQFGEYSKSLCRVPVVALLVQGDSSSIHYVLEHLKNSLPLVVIKGSGGLADVLAFAHYEVHRKYQCVIDNECREKLLKPGLSRKISFTFPESRGNVIQDYLCDRVLECITVAVKTGFDYIYVLDARDQLKKAESLSYHILQSLFKTQRKNAVNWKYQMKKDLLLTLDWNCAETAMSEVFLTYPKFKVNHSLFEAALFMEDREAFVSLFLQRGFLVHKFLSSSRLLSLFKKSLDESFFYDVCWQGLLKYKMKEDLTDDFINISLNYVFLKMTSISIYMSSEELDLFAIGMYTLNYKKQDDASFAEQKALVILMLWALLSKRIKLSHVLWTHSGMPVSLALVASLILHRILPFAKKPNEKADLEQQSVKFAEMAIGVFNISYEDEPSRTFNMLDERSPLWEGHTLVEIATLARNKVLVSHPCCQKWITKVFMGNIRVRELTWGFLTLPEYIKVIVSALFLFPMYIWILFKPIAIPSETPDADDIFSSQESGKESSQKQEGKLSSEKFVHPPLYQMIYWMWSAPITKFWVYHFFYIFFLCIFSLAVIWPSCGLWYLDMICTIWIALITLENIRCTYAAHRSYSHASLFIKCVEILYMGMLIAFYTVARIFALFFDPYTVKVLLCASLLYFYYRIMFIYLPISSTLGPLLHRLKYMIFKDFKNFLYFTVLVLISNGIILQAIIYPDYPLVADMFRKVFHRAWISFFLTPASDFGETPENCESWLTLPKKNSTFCRIGKYVDYTCANPGVWPYVFGIQYMILLKLILSALLFAVFSYTHFKLQKSSVYAWKFQRYQMVLEYVEHSSLPPPFNLISYVTLVFQSLWKSMLILRKKWGKKSGDELESLPNMSRRDFNYWMQLTRNYSEKNALSRGEALFIKEKSNMLAEVIDSVNYQAKIIHKANSQVAELDADVSYARLCIRTRECRIGDDSGEPLFSIHVLSRQTPYPDTKIDRYPVPDKYVPWEVMWLNYEPEFFTPPRSNFQYDLQVYVDDNVSQYMEIMGRSSNILALQWNIDYTDANGVFRGRQSWISDRRSEPIIYKLQQGLPQNPMGRTGIKGRGYLPQWGPNHYIYVIITRKSTNPSLKGQFDYLETWQNRRNNLSFPGGFIKHENRYSTIQNFFKTQSTWESEADMIQFFESRLVDASDITSKIQMKMFVRGYLDDPLNTDQAWKEVELWHVHYIDNANLEQCLKSRMAWRLITEDVFVQLSNELAKLLQQVMRETTAMN